jgi:hypothetical protein
MHDFGFGLAVGGGRDRGTYLLAGMEKGANHV